ncbi:MAG: phosphoserine transaminase [Acidimicrobiia bacterium]|nr:phosphoserine transaminase [Acidimicrobiia bacterium]MDH5238329.1 phosphoserine transaminase [Acidimicrobiia bacterium]
MTPIEIPPALLPADGRFCSGPGKVRVEALEALAATGATYMGTSHRFVTVQFKVAELRNGLAEMFALPDGYEVLLGNGGSTSFWDAASFGLIERRSHHLSYGEFSSKFATVTEAAPHLERPEVITAEPGTRPDVQSGTDVDAYCYPHNETSTGVIIDPTRPDDDGLVLVDATSAAGGVRFDPNQTDVYYFAPQKALASDGGLWLAACSPAAIDRIERLAASDRWCPATLDLKIALDNSRKDQTYNTPALATIFLAAEQVNWINDQGGLEWAAGRCDQSAATIYGWAEASDYAAPFVTDIGHRSPIVATIDLDERLSADDMVEQLRLNGILDTAGYRKLGRNQLRIALFPAIEPSDVEALTHCIDHLAERL